MKNNIKTSYITTIGLAIFSMLFGAGNIIYPIKAGVLAGSQNFAGIIGFILTGVFLPVIGLISIILFDGNYKEFFQRLGKTPGNLAIFYCMLIIGPLLAMPRCITVPYAMLSPFIPAINPLIFSIVFVVITFLLTYRESSILTVLGNVISPLLVLSLGFILIKGLSEADVMVPQIEKASDIFFQQLFHGFQTLDLLGALFFAYIVLKILTSNASNSVIETKKLALLSLKGGLIGAFLLMLVYIGFSYLGAYYGHFVDSSMNGAEMFSIICKQIIPKYGVFIIIVAVLMACLSTISALAAVTAEYLHDELFKKKVSYLPCLIITLIITLFIANFGLTNILKYGELPINIGYPIIITIVFCNLAYKLWGFTPIKIPALIVAIYMVSIHFFI